MRIKFQINSLKVSHIMYSQLIWNYISVVLKLNNFSPFFVQSINSAQAVTNIDVHTIVFTRTYAWMACLVWSKRVMKDI